MHETKLSPTLMLDSFPSNAKPRPEQVRILNLIEANLDKYDYFVVNAPTGVGKSHIACTISSYFAKKFLPSAIITATKILQDNYHDEFPHLPVIKGKNNFACQYLLDIKKIKPGLPVIQYVRNGLTCSSGPCDKDTGNEDEICRYRDRNSSPSRRARTRTGNEDEICRDRDFDCEYYVQRDIGLESSEVIMNYASLFALKAGQQEGLDRYAMIYDEAHNIEDQLVNYGNKTYSKAFLKQREISTPVRDIGENDTDKVLDLLYEIQVRCKKLRDGARDPEVKKGYDNDVNAAAQQQQNIERDPENFMFDVDEDTRSNISIIPLRVHKLRDRFLDAPKQFFLSATITKDSISRDLGIPADEICEIQTPKHPFSLESRKINFLNTTRVTQSYFFNHPEDRKRSILQIQEVARMHPDERGLVLITRKSDLDLMRKWFGRDVQERIIEGHSTNSDDSGMNDSLDALRKSKNGILVSASAWEGIDLKDGLARWYVIYKMPWLDLSDKRISRIKSISHSWYSQKCITKLIQGMGRCVRSADDWAVGYCIDSGIQNGLKRNKWLIPTAYHDVVSA